MPLRVKVGNGVAPTSTGDQVITGVGFEPGLVMFVNTRNLAAEEVKSRAYWTAGFAYNTTQGDQLIFAYNAADNTGTSDNGTQIAANTRCLITNTVGTSSTLSSARLTALGSDGFTLDWVDVDVAHKFSWMAIEGFSDVGIIEFESGNDGNAGNQAYTGLGFEPELVIFLGGRSTDTGPSIGFANGTDQAFSMGFAERNKSTTQTARYQSTSHCFATMNARAVFTRASLVSMDSDGFTLNWDTVNSAGQGDVVALCLRGVTSKIGSDTQPTSTGGQVVTSDIDNKGLILASANATTAAGAVNDSEWSFGWTDGTNQVATNWTDKDNVGTTNTRTGHATDHVLAMRSAPNATLDAESDITSLDDGSFEIDWTTVDATEREFIFLSIGNESSGGGGPDYTLDADSGEFLLIGETAAFDRSYTMDADGTTYVLTGIDADFSVSYTLTSDVGVFTLTGVDTDFVLNYVLDLDAGTFTLTGIDADFDYDTGPPPFTELVAESGLFTLTGVDGGFSRTYELDAETGTFVLTGQDSEFDIGLPGSYEMLAETVMFDIRFGRTDLLTIQPMAADGTAFLLTGEDAGLTLVAAGEYNIDADAASFTLTGIDSAFDWDLFIGADSGSFVLTGIDVDLIRGYELTADQGSFDLTGIDAEFLRTFEALLEAGTFTLTGNDAALVLVSDENVAGFISILSATLDIPASVAVISIPRAIATLGVPRAIGTLDI